jgi:hypothetical protein
MAEKRNDLLYGTLDFLVLRTVRLEALQGYGIQQRLFQVTRGALDINGAACLRPAQPGGPGAARLGSAIQFFGDGLNRRPLRRCSCTCSKTIRTARSRNSRGYLLGRPMGSILSLNEPSDKSGAIHASCSGIYEMASSNLEPNNMYNRPTSLPRQRTYSPLADTNRSHNTLPHGRTSRSHNKSAFVPTILGTRNVPNQ